jgi:hypothetical protein
MSTPQTAPESHEDNKEALIMEGAQTADSVLDRNKDEIFMREKEAYARFGEWVESEIKDLEAEIMEECGTEASS